MTDIMTTGTGDDLSDIWASIQAGASEYGESLLQSAITLAADEVECSCVPNFWALALEYLTAAFEVRFTEYQPEVPAVQAPVLPTGTFTVVLGSDDDYVTLRIEEDFRADAPKGSRVAQFLYGPDNTSSFRGFAFVTAGRIHVWKKAGNVERQRKALEALCGANDPAEYGMTYAMRSGRCWACGKKLTVPASLHRGLGPICASRIS